MAEDVQQPDSFFNPQLGFTTDSVSHRPFLGNRSQVGLVPGNLAPPAPAPVLPPPQPPQPESTVSHLSTTANEHLPTFYIPLHHSDGEDSDKDDVRNIRAMYKELFFETNLSGPFESSIIRKSDLIYILTNQYRDNSTTYHFSFHVDANDDGAANEDGADMMVVKIELAYTIGPGRVPITETKTLYFHRFLTASEQNRKREFAKYTADCLQYTESISDLKKQLEHLQESIRVANEANQGLESENKRLKTSQESMQNRIADLDKYNDRLTKKLKDTLQVVENLYTDLKQFDIPQDLQ